MRHTIFLNDTAEMEGAAVNLPAPWPQWYPGSGWERRFDTMRYFVWAANNWHYSLYMSAAYLVAVFTGIQLMKSRKPFPLKWSLVAWNAVLAIFSILGSYRTVPYVLYQLGSSGGGYAAVVCQAPTIQRKTLALWTLLFTWSKIWEFGDTAFLVLRKRPVIGLHWFHHAVTAVMCFWGQRELQIAGMQMIAINFSIHGVMYFYYAARAAGVKISPGFASWITRAQIAQMFANLAANVYAWYLLDFTEYPCTNNRTVLVVTSLVLGAFAVLFINFFIRSYLTVKVKVK